MRPAADRPEESFDPGLQHERTALAWERTAIAAMVVGVVFARYAATTHHLLFTAVGFFQVGVGGVLLVWAGRHYDDLHGPLRAGDDVVHPRAAATVGITTIAVTALAIVLAVVDMV